MKMREAENTDFNAQRNNEQEQPEVKERKNTLNEKRHKKQQ